ncbi:leucine-rich repeat receptor protein kinase HPCA1-like isoform X2 [Amaranthus tricolor]|uniref:leucine-rich repeat receptor protein kinase HPCA1-like isoform X2 n=1 Tax=Amaranthus tricolor TaxID=29722 RepID=UPI002583B5D1|nr:leucine-rich repeat receptor protein kinase HPCA1-like isoform X2 [Amaranthus tricolor]XP_057523662.1 leucine-rich repeat receptor protein kinase HPCA1-like isoform X2 [Amaranthus tricolor]XP_057523663.1 leucine-rich repeat receptor protein kinase HPCA1-like isoform X2 [Amaranthus tricolor]XP_057523664.1 leucine-rich repeat receptor protein kinase HPCA1-like isoform X2 [Amaranthus tricolor]
MTPSLQICSGLERKWRDLSNNQYLTGHLPANIGYLQNLDSLVLVGCNFSGPIPESLGSIQKLTHLFLNLNHFSGSIPHSIGNLTNLIWLDLSENQLNGALPVSNATAPGLDMLLKAEHFHLGNNRFSGEISPRLFSSRMALKHVILNENQLNGNIPDSLGLVRTLEVIRLDRNFFSGPMPQNLSMLTRMSELYLANNNLSGPIPDLSGMNLLTYVDLSNNSFNKAAAPQWFETLLDLTTLIMENTGLESHISTALLSLPHLESVILSSNQLNGTLEISASVSSSLRLLDLRNNSIDGFSSAAVNRSISVMLDENPFCLKAEAARICNNSRPLRSFIPLEDCAPLPCFSDPIFLSDCRRPYLGSLFFRSFSFSDLTNSLYYAFLTESLQPRLEKLQIPIDRVCLVSSMIDLNGYLVLNISFLPPDGYSFNRTGVSTINNYLNNHIYPSPYGPYYYSDLSYTNFPGPGKNTGLIVGISIAGSVLALLTIVAVVYGYRQRRIAQLAVKLNNPFASWNDGNVPRLKGARWFSFEDVRQCTGNLSHESEIGVGGYGKVYKGKLESGELVAIKRAQQGSLQGALEFKTEIELLSRVHHKNVVNLIGFCYDKGEQMLIYEYVANGSLRAALSGKSGVRLNWIRRLKIALGAARGLAYLHELADPPIVHRDIKSDNILLSDHLNAKVADFGLSKLLSDHRGQVTTQVKGTMGYLDPEYYMTNILTEKSDVYSFGVVMLELVTGRMPLENNKYIVREVRETMKESGYIYNLVDPAIRVDALIGMEEFVKLALSCLQDMSDERPSMGEVVKEIENMIEANNLNDDVESVATSASFEGGYRYPYSSNSNVSFGSSATASSPFIK